MRNTNGISVSLRTSLIMSKILSVVVPAARARWSASWMTGPSAMGSLKGIPSSTNVAPASSMARISFFVVSRSGSPAVMKGANIFLCFCSTAANLLMNLPPQISGNGRHVFIAPSGQIYNDDFIFRQSRRQLHGIGQRMGAFHRRDDALCFGQVLERLH